MYFAFLIVIFGFFKKYSESSWQLIYLFLSKKGSWKRFVEFMDYEKNFCICVFSISLLLFEFIYQIHFVYFILLFFIVSC